jgi:hypothetical protein
MLETAQSPIDSDAVRASGVYAIYYKNRLVYVGKAKLLYQRIRKHRRTLREAGGIDAANVTWRALAMSCSLMTGFEEYLISEEAPEWNGKGFGSNAHGAGRPHQQPSIWNKTYERAETR